MSEIFQFIREVGFPIALAVGLCYAVYQLGKIGLNLLLESWKAKDARLSELEQRVERINNGQRESLERRLDQGTEAIHRVSGCLDRMGQAFEEFARARPCLQDSDATKLTNAIADEMTPDPKTLARIAKRKERQQGAGG